MAERSITYCVEELQVAWWAAEKKFKELYPDLPQPFLTCTYRSHEEQDELYAQGRTRPGNKVTNAKGGQSNHNFNPSKAFDVAFKKDGKLDWSTDLFRKFSKTIRDINKNIKWGGTWRTPDYPHFELTV